MATHSALVDLLSFHELALLTNRFNAGSGFYTRQQSHGESLRHSILDYSFLPLSWWPSVRAEGVCADSGSAIGSDHNLCFADLSLPRACPAAPSTSADSGDPDFFPPMPRPRLDTSKLAASAECRADLVSHLSTLLPAFEAAVQTAMASHDGSSGGRTRAASQVCLTLTSMLSSAVTKVSAQYHFLPDPPAHAPPVHASPADYDQAGVPSAAAAVEAARLTLLAARGSQSAAPADPSAFLAHARAHKALRRARCQALRSAHAAHFLSLDLPAHPSSSSAWSRLHVALGPTLPSLGLPRHVRAPDGSLIPDLTRAAYHWHLVREEIGRDQAGARQFDTHALEALRQEDARLATDPAFHAACAPPPPPSHAIPTSPSLPDPFTDSPPHASGDPCRAPRLRVGLGPGGRRNPL